MPKDEIERIRKIPITRLLGMKDTHRRFHIKCPFHGEKSPSLAIYPDQSWYCFGCGKHGSNAIDFTIALGSS
ncbi:MAG TPA: CHC2 zinc finger domain-containing protein, partial [Candidatus Pelethenecus sp.]|nr:CHC2 zinc finger domain-containing protein [Candidatus Pelethenecus sp.]